ncbi:ATP-dependent helicase/nuclease subunit A [Candidatus Termititenax aidoneus]|uniref:DNA 3'-5' helicase n=1 Tax=Termititenax aidoneus TaxID=2218524 RepID=A0A388TCK3_TERA1|nr:ATP-dependent helicase/nuclease subunit A [Candidatus Termititenax aidoneus]
MAELTKKQKEIVALRGENISINANAGAGKTFTLIERITALLAAGTPAGKILAVTFTDKAAQELKTKLTAQAREKDLPYWEIESAYIGTFHSLCGRILRENCFQAGLPPNFETLPEIPAELLLEETIENCLEEKLASGSTALDKLLEAYSRQDLAECCVKILAALRAYGLPAEKLRAKSAAQIQAKILEINDRYLQQIYAKIQELCRALSGRPVSEKFAEMRAAVSKLGAKKYSLENLRAIGENIDLRSGGKDAADDKAKLKAIKQFYANNSDFIYFDEAKEAYFAELTVCLSELLAEIQAAYKRRKIRKNQLDFDDLQERALQLLESHAELAKHYQDFFAAALVDEFQDTNEVQDKLLALLAGTRKLCVVGDWKQSIYLFRYADLRLFQKYRERYAKGGGYNMDLQENFRSAKEIVDFANAFCAPLFAADPDTPDYEPLIFGNTEELRKLQGRVDIAFAPVPEKADSSTVDEYSAAEKARQIEAAYIARQIQELQKARPFSDQNKCALLLPYFSHINIFTEALDAAGLKYVLESGGNYYSQGEVVDTLNFLSALNNPADDFRLAAALRSEMANLSDQALFLLTRGKNKKQPLYDLLNHFDPKTLAGADAEKLKKFLAVYRELRGLIGKLPVSKILQLTLEKTFFINNALSHRENAERKLANLNKLLDISKGFDDRSLQYFISYIQKLQEKESREEEADLSDNSSVRIMTIHKAKGLEFENVFVADLYRHRTALRLAKIIFHKDLYKDSQTQTEPGIPLALSSAADRDAPEADNISLAYAHAKRKQEQLELEESRRLFYVAITRAKEKLFLTSACRPEKDAELTEECLQTRNIGLWLRYFCVKQPQIRHGAAVIESIEAQPLHKSAQTILKPPALDFTESAPAAEPHYKLNVLPATLAAYLLADSRKFILDYFHGFTMDEHLTPKNNSLDMQKIGTAVHRIIAAGSSAQLELPDNFTAAEKDYLQQCLANYAKSALPDLLQKNEHFHEVSLDYLLDGVRFNGVADLIVKTTDGWEIYDFKTSRTPTPENAAQYKNQLSIYAAILRQLLPGQKIKGFVFYLHAGQTSTPVELNENVLTGCLREIQKINAVERDKV